MCEDVKALVKTLGAKGIPCTPPQDTKYVWGIGQMLEQEAFLLQSVSVGQVQADCVQSRKVLGALADHLGSIRVLTDEDGGVTERTSWGPWGERFEGGSGVGWGIRGTLWMRSPGSLLLSSDTWTHDRAGGSGAIRLVTSMEQTYIDIHPILPLPIWTSLACFHSCRHRVTSLTLTLGLVRLKSISSQSLSEILGSETSMLVLSLMLNSQRTRRAAMPLWITLGFRSSEQRKTAV